MGLFQRTDRGDMVQPSGAPPRLKVSRGADGGLRLRGPQDPDQDDRSATNAEDEQPGVTRPDRDDR